MSLSSLGLTPPSEVVASDVGSLSQWLYASALSSCIASLLGTPDPICLKQDMRPLAEVLLCCPPSRGNGGGTSYLNVRFEGHGLEVLTGVETAGGGETVCVCSSWSFGSLRLPEELRWWLWA